MKKKFLLFYFFECTIRNFIQRNLNGLNKVWHKTLHNSAPRLRCVWCFWIPPSFHGQFYKWKCGKQQQKKRKTTYSRYAFFEASHIFSRELQNKAKKNLLAPLELHIFFSASHPHILLLFILRSNIHFWIPEKRKRKGGKCGM